MKIKKYLICFATIGIIFGCGEQIDLNEEAHPSNFTQDEFDVPDISDFQNYEVQTPSDFDKILKLSQIENKPVLVYTTGLNSVGYRATEIKLWPDSLVYPVLKNDFLIVTIYVDDRTPFLRNDSVSTFGDYWMNYEITRYNLLTQPVFEIVDYKNESMNKEIATYGTHNDPKIYRAWLEEGLANFHIR